MGPQRETPVKALSSGDDQKTNRHLARSGIHTALHIPGLMERRVTGEIRCCLRCRCKFTMVAADTILRLGLEQYSA